jgi:hypothetical protein
VKLYLIYFSIERKCINIVSYTSIENSFLCDAIIIFSIKFLTYKSIMKNGLNKEYNLINAKFIRYHLTGFFSFEIMKA